MLLAAAKQAGASQQRAVVSFKLSAQQQRLRNACRFPLFFALSAFLNRL
jgi:hypothetical protein